MKVKLSTFVLEFSKFEDKYDHLSANDMETALKRLPFIYQVYWIAGTLCVGIDAEVDPLRGLVMPNEFIWKATEKIMEALDNS